MAIFTFRTRRVAVEAPAKVFRVNKSTKLQSTGWSNGTIVNASRYGLSLIVQNMIIDGDHLFYTTLEGKGFLLRIILEKKGVTDQHVDAVAIWMDRCIFKDAPSFKIGINYIQKKAQFFKAVKNSH